MVRTVYSGGRPGQGKLVWVVLTERSMRPGHRPRQNGAVTSQLAGFTAPTRRWFERSFGQPTPVQAETWRAASAGENVLVISPTGTGKTLAAFLWSIDQLTSGQAEPAGGVGVLYISPLKALGVDVEKNLRAPLRGIAAVAADLGATPRDIRVGVRSGDTSPADRRRLLTQPPHILITTPESLFLILSSGARSTLVGVKTVIVDEIHALAGSKRGAHLAISLERLAAMNPAPVQRIGLSATVRPPERVAAFLGGAGRDVTIVAPDMAKTWDLAIRLPVDDLTQPGAGPAPTPAPAPPQPGQPAGRSRPSTMSTHLMAGEPGDARATKPSIWPPVEQAVYDLIRAHRSTICFVNSRGVAERLTAHLNELAADHGVGPVARTHHGSVSKASRAQIEADLKAGVLACVVATNSLELGIDMGAVDLVIQVGAPPSVASGLQRIGRGGHRVGDISHGVLFPLSRPDLLQTAVVVRRMGAAQIEAVPSLHNPLDLVAQQVVSICLAGPQSPEAIFQILRGADCCRELPRSGFDAVVAMLTGKYPSDDFAELRPRLTLDPVSGYLSARPGALRLVTTSGGTIPDRGLYPVYISAGPQSAETKSGGPRRVGELDEEMVYESRVGDVFILGSSTWRIDQITPHQVMVSPAPGRSGRLPFWHGDDQARPVELGLAIARLVGQLGADGTTRALAGVGLDERAEANLLAYIRDQRLATGTVPDQETVLIERQRDDLGAWRVMVHCPLGKAVLRPWTLAVRRRLRQAGLGDVRALVSDDGIVFQLGDLDQPPGLGALLAIDPGEIERLVVDEVQSSSLFAAHFRQCAARALLLPKPQPNQRSALWRQRLRSAQLLGVANAYPDFPIVAEALRECLEDVFDLAGLTDWLRAIAARRVRLVEVETRQPSPFGRSLLFGFTGAFIYDDDQPLAERAAAASGVDPVLLAALLGHSAPTMLDPVALAEVEARRQRTQPERRASSAEALWDLIRQLGPLSAEECAERCRGDGSAWLAELVAAGRVVSTTAAGPRWLVVSDDLALLDDLVTESTRPAALTRLVNRWLRSHALVTASQLRARYPVAAESVEGCLEVAVEAGLALTGRFEAADDEPRYIAPEVLADVKRWAAQRLRAGVKPVSQRRFASFLTRWNELDRPGRGIEAVVGAVDQLAGYPLPASMVESIILPARVTDYEPVMLDQLMSLGEITWSGYGRIPPADGWIRLWPADLPIPVDPAGLAGVSPAAAALYQRLSPGGAWSVADLMSPEMGPAAVEAGLWELVWAGLVTADTMAPLRTLDPGRARLRRPVTPRPRRVLRPVVTSSARSVGRWLALPVDQSSQTERLLAGTELALGRAGILTRGSALAEPLTAGFSDVYQVLRGLEDQGRVRRGYFVEDLGGAQFALPGAVDRLRQPATSPPLVLAACDPANPWGASLAWPQSQGHRPTRQAGALVVLDDGWPVLYLERGLHTVVTFGGDDNQVVAGLAAVGHLVDQRRLTPLRISRINAAPALADSRWTTLMSRAGFTMVPQGFERR